MTLGHHAGGDEMFPKREPSFDLRELSGCGVDEAKRRCEMDGFSVEVIDLDKNAYVTLDLRPNRIRLKTRKGHVIEARQG
jgi:hypothetical protein